MRFNEREADTETEDSGFRAISSSESSWKRDRASGPAHHFDQRRSSYRERWAPVRHVRRSLDGTISRRPFAVKHLSRNGSATSK